MDGIRSAVEMALRIRSASVQGRDEYVVDSDYDVLTQSYRITIRVPSLEFSVPRNALDTPAELTRRLMDQAHEAVQTHERRVRGE